MDEMSSSSDLLPSAARRLDGKVALITGGASGIGECTARLFRRHGAKVVIADVQDKKGRFICSDIGGSDSATFVHCDVTVESDVEAAVDAAVSAYGKLDIMFNNAGILGTMNRRILDTERSEFDRVMATNVTGSFVGTKHAARVMIPAGNGGTIIITSSLSSVIGGMATYAYTCSKHALVGLVKDAAAELGKHGIRVNCVSPFAVATPMSTEGSGMSVSEVEAAAAAHANLKGVVLKAEDVAKAVLFLASEESRYVSGHNLLVDGGLSVV